MRRRGPRGPPQALLTFHPLPPEPGGGRPPSHRLTVSLHSVPGLGPRSACLPFPGPSLSLVILLPRALDLRSFPVAGGIWAGPLRLGRDPPHLPASFLEFVSFGFFCFPSRRGFSDSNCRMHVHWGALGGLGTRHLTPVAWPYHRHDLSPATQPALFPLNFMSGWHMPLGCTKIALICFWTGHEVRRWLFKENSVFI